MKNSMEEIYKFFKKNVIAITMGLAIYFMYLYFAYAGNRICDCETTEKYSSSQAAGRGSVNHFYHK
jgi:hypothetical protein